jgi:rRNA maturation RNase YbeY
LKIRIFYDDVRYRLQGSKKVLKLIDKVIEKENRLSGDLNFIITNDRNLRKMNKEFLKHNYYTDVIAFGYNENKIVNGEIYISINTVKINSHNYKVSLRNELIRVMIHGTLHLCGYKDDKDENKASMKDIEDKWMTIYSGK